VGQRSPDGSAGPKPDDRTSEAPGAFDLIEGWHFVEADFQREYGIDLRVELDAMTWRRFTVLVRSLSPVSATAVYLSSRAFYERPDVREISDKQQVEDGLAKFFGRPSVKVN
jgi:hypothetical protein